MLKGVIQHIGLTIRHKHYVFVYACKLGIPYRGLVHDLSKYSLEELLPSGKYYTGYCSPQRIERQNNDGYSLVCQHHTGRNKHHWQYWIDYSLKGMLIYRIPYEYSVEFVADSLAASKVYGGKNYKKDEALTFFKDKKDAYYIHPAIKDFAMYCFEEYAEHEFKNLTPKNLKAKYNEFASKYPKVIVCKMHYEGLEQK